MIIFLEMVISRELERKKTQSIEKTGSYLEPQDQPDPMTARIYPTLILQSHKNSYFEIPPFGLNSGKGSVSTYLPIPQAHSTPDVSFNFKSCKRTYNFSPSSVSENFFAGRSQMEAPKVIPKRNQLTAGGKNSSDPESVLKYHSCYLPSPEKAGQLSPKLKQNFLNNYSTSNE